MSMTKPKFGPLERRRVFSRHGRLGKAMSAWWLAAVLASAAWGAETPSAAPLRPADIPAKAIWVAHVDLCRLRGSLAGRSMLAQLDRPEMALAYASLQSDFNFDLHQQLRALTFYSTGTGPGDPVLLVYGDFDPDRIAALAQALNGYRGIRRGHQTLHSWVRDAKPGKDGAEQRTFAAVFGRGIVIFGQKETTVGQALGVLERSAPGLDLGKEFPQLAVSATNSLVAAGMHRLELPDANPGSALQRRLKTSQFRIVEMGRETTAILTLETDDPTIASEVAIVGKGFAALSKLQKDKPETAALAEALTWAQDGAVLKLTATLPSEDVAAWIVKLIAKPFLSPPPPAH